MSGPITRIDQDQRQLNIGDMIVDYNNASIDEDTLNSLDEGVEIVVVGNTEVIDDILILIAEAIILINDEGNISLGTLSTTGEITEFRSPESFTVTNLFSEDVSVRVDTSTVFVNGTESELQNGAEISIRAIFNGELQSYIIVELEFISKPLPTQFDLRPDLEIEQSTKFNLITSAIVAPVEAVEVADDFFIQGTLQLLATQFNVGNLFGSLLLPEPQVTDISEFSVGQWTTAILSRNLSNQFTGAQYSIEHANLIESPLSRVVLLDNVSINGEQIELLGFDLTINEETQCFTTDGLDAPCLSSINEGDRTYVEIRDDFSVVYLVNLTGSDATSNEPLLPPVEPLPSSGNSTVIDSIVISN